MQRLLGFAHPTYAHLPLVLGADGRKLSKQESALPVDPREPMPALRAALEFLGQNVTGEAGPAALLTHAVQRFDVRAIVCKDTARRPIAAVRKESCPR